MDKVDEILERRVDKVLPSKEDLKKLIQKKKIRLYNGIDPTATKLHLGHTVPLRKLMDFANQGHEVILLFGTGTVLVGDPSQRETGRKLITEKEVEQNIKTWKEQVRPIVDFNKIKILKNGDWLKKLTLKDIVKIASNISAVQLFKRDMFQKRIAKGDTVWYHETMYPLLQGYDSVVMDVDLEIGGTDQEFNMLIGRELQKKMNNKEKYVLTLPMISGTDGKPMSKTSDNCVWLTDSANDMFAKLMGILDTQITPYLELVTDIPIKRVNKVKILLKNKKLHPIEAKKELAIAVATQFHGNKAAIEAKRYFEKTFQKGKFPEKAKEIRLGKDETLIEFIATLTKSKSEAKRLISQGAININGKEIKDTKFKLSGGEQIKVGKKIFVKTKIE
jgi:tyrosyl-tRNA synthetase